MESFTIEQKLPSLNEYINMLKAPNGQKKGAKFKKEFDELCCWYAIKHKARLKEICKEPVLIWFIWHEKNRLRDVDNVKSGAKYILDALQKCRILENDNPSHVPMVYDSIVYGTEAFVEVNIYKLSEREILLKAYNAYENVRLMCAR